MIDRLPQEWVKPLCEYQKIYVGFSGGLDSTVLLHALSQSDELRTKLTAVHINHALSPNADKWQVFCEQFAGQNGVAFITFQPDFSKQSNIEAAARDARYKIFTSLLTEKDVLVLAHHRDDQAETLLLNLFRGAGIDGLAAMPAEKKLGLGRLVRPLLEYTRLQLRDYAEQHHLDWADDESNADISYSRNYLRHEVIPLLADKWPGIINNLNRTAIHCQRAKETLAALACSDAKDLSLKNKSLSVIDLKRLSYTRLSNVLREWLANNHVRRPSTKRFEQLINDVIFSRQDAEPCISWDNISIKRFQDEIYILDNQVLVKPQATPWYNFPESLFIEGLGHLISTPVSQGLCIAPGSQVHIRFREGGEQLRWKGQSKSLKKLFQQWKIPPWQREKIPLIYIDGQLAAVGGVISDCFYGEESAYQIKVLAS